MTYGFNEQYYTEARRLGVIFIPYSPDNKPTVELIDDKPCVHFNDTILNEPLSVSADYLVLSTGVSPAENAHNLGNAFDIKTDAGGFFEEADTKWRPVESSKQGVFIAGTAHSPMPLKDVLMQAQAAAMKTYSALRNAELVTVKSISTVHNSLCSRCRLCVDACPYAARSYDEVEHTIVVDTGACQGCGLCAVTCRNNAAEVVGWNDKQFMSVIDTSIMDELHFLNT